jgi:hypothetical protein
LIFCSSLHSNSTSVLRGAKKFRVGTSTPGRIRGSRTLPLVTAVFFALVFCSSE